MAPGAWDNAPVLDPKIKREDGFFASKDGTRLYWQSYNAPEPRAHVALIHGFLDHSGRYDTVYEALTAQGMSVHGFDYRGHGQAAGKRGHCESFSQYVDDMEAHMDRVRANAGGRPVFVFAHSHGALITTLWGLAGKATGVQAVVLSAPWFRLKFPPPMFKLILAKTVGRLLPSMAVPLELDNALVSRDPDVQARTAADPLYGHATTPRWNEERGKAQAEAMRRATEWVLPTLFFVGADDQVAHPDAVREFYEHATSKDKELKVYPSMVHECFNDIGREAVLADVGAWLNNRVRQHST